jgi:hypothetical protein
VTGAVVMRTSGGLVQHNPTENRIRALLGALSRDGYVTLARVGSSSTHYVQVWLRSSGVLQLEYRAGQPSAHYQTRTQSREKVVAALSGWSRGEDDWRDDFEWISIEEWFTHQ